MDSLENLLQTGMVDITLLLLNIISQRFNFVVSSDKGPKNQKDKIKIDLVEYDDFLLKCIQLLSKFDCKFGAGEDGTKLISDDSPLYCAIENDDFKCVQLIIECCRQRNVNIPIKNSVDNNDDSDVKTSLLAILFASDTEYASIQTCLRINCGEILKLLLHCPEFNLSSTKLWDMLLGKDFNEARMTVMNVNINIALIQLFDFFSVFCFCCNVYWLFFR